MFVLFARFYIRNICRPEDAKDKTQKKSHQGKENDTYLAPEFCYIYPFPAVLWYKSIILPSVLHRIHYLLLAEDLRWSIVSGTNIGSVDLPKGECLLVDVNDPL